MSFSIRNVDADDFAKCEEAYRQHLKRFKKTSNTDLWKYFSRDFFHDGDIDSIRIDGDLKTVVIRLGCPNIKRFKADGDFEYAYVMFECTFRNISTFAIQYETPEHSWDVRKSLTTFLYAEINTSPILASLQPQDDHDPDSQYSLLILLNADNSTIWLEMLFSQVDVVADERTAFALMEVDPKFEVPAWSQEKDKGDV